MKLLFITPCLANGGAEHVVARLASALAGRHEVHVACTWPAGNERGMYPVDPRVRIHEIVAQFPIRPRTPAMIYYLEHMSQAKQLRQLKREIGVDASVSVLTSCNYDNVKSRIGEPVIVSIRNILEPALGEERISANAMARIVSKTGRRADAVVCVSKNVAAEQRERFGVPSRLLRVIYNPIDFSQLDRDAEQEPENAAFAAFRQSHGCVIVSMGRFVPQKGHAHLLRAFAEARKSHPEAGLVLLGRGALEDELRALAQRLGISDHVLFAGFAQNPAAYLSRADVFAMSSRREGFSNALLEAAAMGLPIVSTDCNSGPRELLAPDTPSDVQTQGLELAGYGMLVPVCTLSHDVEDPLDASEQCFAQALVRMLEDEHVRQRYATLARERAAAFTIEAIAGEWERLIVDTVKGKARR